MSSPFEVPPVYDVQCGDVPPHHYNYSVRDCSSSPNICIIPLIILMSNAEHGGRVDEASNSSSYSHY